MKLVGKALEWYLISELSKKSVCTELISALQTTEEVMRRSRAFAEACNKEVTTSADTPGA